MIVTFLNREGIEVHAEAYCERRQECRATPYWHISATFPIFLAGRVGYDKRDLIPCINKRPIETRVSEYGFDNACASFLSEIWDMALVKGIHKDLGDEVVGVVED